MAANSRFAVATHIMISLALHKDEELISSGHLSSTVNTNAVVVRRILSDLQKAGLLETQFGRTGGARLARPPHRISLYEILQAVDEGHVFAFNRNKPNKSSKLSVQMKSILQPVFDAADQALAASLRERNLGELVAKAQSERVTF